MGRRNVLRSSGVGIIMFVCATFPALLGVPANAGTSPACPAGSVALTFDDGPVAGRTNVILAALDWVGVDATFFMVGSRVERFPRVAEDVVRCGHAVANHTWEHVDLRALSDAEVTASIRRTDDALKAVGIEPLQLVRPPFLMVNHRVREIIEEQGFTTMLETVNPRDWDDIDVNTVVDRVVNRARDGAVIGLHDGHRLYEKSGAATTGIVERLADKGFCFGVLDASGLVTGAMPAMMDDRSGVWLNGGLSR